MSQTYVKRGFPMILPFCMNSFVAQKTSHNLFMHCMGLKKRYWRPLMAIEIRDNDVQTPLDFGYFGDFPIDYQRNP